MGRSPEELKLAQACELGDEATFKAPNGRQVTVQIVDAKPYSA